MQRPETPYRSPLEHALAIPGADRVALIRAEGRAVTWWAGDAAPGPAEAVAVVELAKAASGLVLTADPDDDLGDVLVISASAFHVLRMVRAASGEEHVAHLTLRRGRANLAMARHEFKVLTERYADAPGARPRHAAARSARPESAQTEPHGGSALDTDGRAEEPAGGPIAEGGTAPLPRRRPGAGPNGPPAAADGGRVPANWFAMFGQPFTTDEAVLERLLGSLRQL